MHEICVGQMLRHEMRTKNLVRKGSAEKMYGEGATSPLIIRYSEDASHANLEAASGVASCGGTPTTRICKYGKDCGAGYYFIKVKGSFAAAMPDKVNFQMPAKDLSA